MFNDFQPYDPREKGIETAVHLRSTEGVDWYDAVKLFAPETMKVVIDSEGVVRDLNTDAARLWPAGLSVMEVAADSLPAPMVTDNNPRMKWRHLDGTFIPLPATRERGRRLHKAQLAMAPLQDAVELGIATDAEVALLSRWKTYRVALARLDVSHANIDWPAAPETTGENG